MSLAYPSPAPRFKSRTPRENSSKPPAGLPENTPPTSLPAGAYEVTVTAPTMKEFVKKDVVVAAAASRLDVKLMDGDSLGTLGDGDRFSHAFFANQKGPSPPIGPTPHLPDGKPDLSGFWQPSEGRPEQAEPLPWAEAIRRERQSSNLRDDPYGRCLPRGVMSWAGQGKFRDYILDNGLN
jgi:hypothetical protein